MPEGDNIHKDRLRLRPILEGKTVQHFWAKKIRGHRPRAGQNVDAVRVHGKHLLIDLAPALTLQVHLGLSGWWQVHPGGEGASRFDQLRRNPRLRLYLATDAGAAACYSAPTIQTYVRDVALGDVPVVADAITPLSNLGPDLRVDSDGRKAVVERAVSRLKARSDGDKLIVDALLDQEVAAGIGNVYKSECCSFTGSGPSQRYPTSMSICSARCSAPPAACFGSTPNGRTPAVPQLRFLVRCPSCTAAPTYTNAGAVRVVVARLPSSGPIPAGWVAAPTGVLDVNQPKQRPEQAAIVGEYSTVWRASLDR